MVSEEGLREFEEQMDKLGVLEDMKSQYVKMEELRREVKAENKKKAKEEGGQSCENQDCPNKGKQRCGGCNFAHYCSRGCQAEAWGEHKGECKEIQMEFRTVVVKKLGIPPGHLMSDPTVNTVTKGAFKVQVMEVITQQLLWSI